MQHKGSDADMSKNYRINLRSILQAGILVSGLLILSPAYAQSIIPDERDIVIETINGMILSGQVVATEKGIVSFKNQYGNLEIPLTQIYRIGGNLFDPQKGIIQEHSVQIQKDGKIIRHYPIMVPLRANQQKVTLLLPGKVLSFKDLEGNPLSYISNGVNTLSRCTIQLPSHLLPVIRASILQEDGVSQAAGTYLYTYRYIPDCAQTFNLEITLAENFHIERVEPAPSQTLSNTIKWEMKLNRQEAAEFQVFFK